MKRGILLKAILAVSLVSVPFSSVFADCEEETTKYQIAKQKYDQQQKDLDDVVGYVMRNYGGGADSSQFQSRVTNRRNSLEKQMVNIKKAYDTTKKAYDKCMADAKKDNPEMNYYYSGVAEYEKGNYSKAISNLEKAYEANPDTATINALDLAYYDYGLEFYNKKDYKNACKYLLSSYEINSSDFITMFYLGKVFENLKDYDRAAAFYYDAMMKTTITSNKKQAKDGYTTNDKKTINAIKVSKDTEVGKQYYLKQINIAEAWKKVKNKNEVIVAVIDDGIYTNHSDLKNNLWKNPAGAYGDDIIVNFTRDGLDNNVGGDHGTMVSGIIGATQNNNVGIAGIAKNVKIMPLRVFSPDGVDPKKTISGTNKAILGAMEYAIDNGANIINLSLGANIAFTDEFDEMIYYAYENGVVVVIAAGNGDMYSGGVTGLDLGTNPISPICNNGNQYKFSIGVGALGRNGYPTNWSNYGDCVDVWAPGEMIYSTSIPEFSGANYKYADGTSFSTPIVTGIIALGYNEYGYVSPDLVFDAITASFDFSEEKGWYLDAAKYIDELGRLIK